MTTLQRVIDFAKDVGVTAHLCTPERFSKLVAVGVFEQAPFCQYVGIVWASKELYYTKKTHWAEIIHELGHLVACPKPPKGSIEWDFFGWEIALMYYIQGDFSEWVKNNKEYAVLDGSELCALNPVELHLMIAERLQHGQSVGLIDDAGWPLTIR